MTPVQQFFAKQTKLREGLERHRIEPQIIQSVMENTKPGNIDGLLELVRGWDEEEKASEAGA